MKDKGQFMIISAIIASLITITLSASISDIQSQTFEPQDTPREINQIKTEISKITADNDITTKEERNFKKMLTYLENYQTTTRFNRTEPCIQVTLRNTQERIELPCIS